MEGCVWVALAVCVAYIVVGSVGGVEATVVRPYLDAPACGAGPRTSPLDGGNLNRVFPGDPAGGPTAKIADYVVRHLIPMADLVLDFHSGGKSLDFVPFAAAHRLADPVQEAACIAAMEAFCAPYSMILREQDPAGMFDTAVEAAGKVFVTTELGGGGTASARTAGIAHTGLRNLLIHAGIVQGTPQGAPTQRIDMTADTCLHVAQDSGLVEFHADLGQTIGQGDALASLWPLDRSGQPPVRVVAQTTGVLAARHFPGLIRPGDCLAVIAHPAPGHAGRANAGVSVDPR